MTVGLACLILHSAVDVGSSGPLPRRGWVEMGLGGGEVGHVGACVVNIVDIPLQGEGLEVEIAIITI